MSSICKYCEIILIDDKKDICIECYDNIRTKKIFICCYKCSSIIKIYENTNINEDVINTINICSKCDK